MIRILVGFLFLISYGCTTKPSDQILIIDIGYYDRIKLGQQIRVIEDNHPALIALDILFLNDSLYIDTTLVNSLRHVNNLVQVVSLGGEKREEFYWDSLRSSNVKFRFGAEGFSNVSTDDYYGMVLPEIPLEQIHAGESIKSFCYVIAEKSFGLKANYKDTGVDVVHFDQNIFTQKFKKLHISDIIAGRFRKDDLQGKIIMLGYVGDDNDENENSFYLNPQQSEVISTVEIHACMVSELTNLD